VVGAAPSFDPVLVLLAFALAAPATSAPADCGPARARASTSAPLQGGIAPLEMETEAASELAATWQAKP